MRALGLVFVAFLMLFTSCGKEGYDYKLEVDMETLTKEQGSIELKLSASSGVVSKSGEEISNTLNVSPNDFKVEVFNAASVKIRKWDKYSEMEPKIRFNVGNFTLKAFYGDSTATGFGMAYFAGKTSFKVEGQIHKPVSVTCRQSNVQIKVHWGDKLLSNYSNCFVTLYRTGFKDSLVFIKNEIRSGYIPVGKIKIKIDLTNKQGEKRTYFSPIDIDAFANDFVNLTVNVGEVPDTGGGEAPDAGGGTPLYDVKLLFKIDSSTDDREIDVLIPGLMKPKDAPGIQSDQVDAETRIITFVEGVGTASLFNISAPGYIRSCLLKTSSPYLLSQGWPAEIDLISAATVPGAIIKLKALGLKWREDMENKTIGFVDFTEVSRNLRYLNGEDDLITLCVTDIYNQTSGDVTYTFKMQPAEISINAIAQTDIWAAKAFVTFYTPNGNPDLFQVEVNSGSGWIEAEATQLTGLSKKGGEIKYLISGLKPQQTYQVRAKYSTITSEAVSVTTEAMLQVENGNFDKWIAGTFRYVGKLITSKNYDQPIFYPWSDGETGGWWDTTNKNTMPTSGTPEYPNYKCFPTVSYTAGRSGNAAQLMAISVGSFDSEAATSGAKAGELYIGSYDTGTTGHAFTARPDTLTFYYQYTPKNAGSDTFEAYIEMRNGNEIIGTGTFTKSVAKDSPISSWELAKQKINYNRTDLKATTIYIRFKSSTADSPAKEKTNVTLAGSVHTVHGGSVLLIDDLTLKY